jgi:hypothetical protein
MHKHINVLEEDFILKKNHATSLNKTLQQTNREDFDHNNNKVFIDEKKTGQKIATYVIV